MNGITHFFHDISVKSLAGLQKKKKKEKKSVDCLLL